MSLPISFIYFPLYTLYLVRPLHGAAVKIADVQNRVRPIYAEDTGFDQKYWQGNAVNLKAEIPYLFIAIAGNLPQDAGGSEPAHKFIKPSRARTPQPSDKTARTLAPATPNVINTQTSNQPRPTVPTAEITPATLNLPSGSRRTPGHSHRRPSQR